MSERGVWDFPLGILIISQDKTQYFFVIVQKSGESRHNGRQNRTVDQTGLFPVEIDWFDQAAWGELPF